MAPAEGIEQILHNRPELDSRNRPVERLESPAKINLGLRIVGRRPDGYHLIESVFWPLDFVDWIEVSPSKHLEVSAQWHSEAPRPFPAPPQGRDNLAFRAAELALGLGAPWHFAIRKRVPIGAGLGGGSSNAGTLLRHLGTKGQFPTAGLATMALALGADVPYFLDPRPAWVQGIGETQRNLEVAAEVTEQLAFVLVVPPSATPTPVIFSKYRGLAVPFAPTLNLDSSGCWDWTRLKGYLAQTENSLQGIAAMEYPLLAEVVHRLKSTEPLFSGLSGTGSTCFAVFQGPGRALEIAKDLTPFCRKTGCQSIIARTHRPNAP